MRAHKVKGRALSDVFATAERLAALEAQTLTVQKTGTGKIAAQLQLALKYNVASSNAVGDFFAAAIDNLKSRTSNAGGVVTAGSNALPLVTAAANAAQTSASNQLSSETAARISARTSIDSASMNLGGTISTMTSAAVADRASIRARGLANTPTTTVSGLTSSAAAAESLRGSAETSTRVALLSTARATLWFTLSTSFASEFQRMNTSCANRFTTLAGGYSAPVQSAGSNDWASWYGVCFSLAVSANSPVRFHAARLLVHCTTPPSGRPSFFAVCCHDCIDLRVSLTFLCTHASVNGFFNPLILDCTSTVVHLYCCCAHYFSLPQGPTPSSLAQESSIASNRR
jgi:hypothetical protein